MGQRTRLNWDIPVMDSFELNRAIYRLPHAEYRRTLDELTDLLELGPLLRKPVRTLSLGERTKCELTGALLHRPRVLFLDEPTLGLDVTMQRRIRAFIAEYNRCHEAAVLLTSHSMADVTALCRRVLVIHQGRLLFDGDLIGLVRRLASHKTIVLDLEDDTVDLRPCGEAALLVRTGGSAVPLSRAGPDSDSAPAVSLDGGVSRGRAPGPREGRPNVDRARRAGDLAGADSGAARHRMAGRATPLRGGGPMTYVRLLRLFVRLSALNDLAYRTHFVVRRQTGRRSCGRAIS
jgi:hypothetical protein